MHTHTHTHTHTQCESDFDDNSNDTKNLKYSGFYNVTQNLYLLETSKCNLIWNYVLYKYSKEQGKKNYP